jgi:CrcB protein
VRLGLLVGVLGGYTTFSTWAVDSVDLLQSGNPGGALANVVLSVGAGLAAAVAGLFVGRSFG